MLSYFVERFGKNSHCREDIYSASSLRELDKFTMQFKDSRALREHFKEKMNIFKEKFAEQIDVWEKLHPGKKNNGAIYANCLLDNVGLITIAIVYAGDDIVPDLVAYNNISNLLDTTLAKSKAMMFVIKPPKYGMIVVTQARSPKINQLGCPIKKYNRLYSNNSNIINVPSPLK